MNKRAFEEFFSKHDSIDIREGSYTPIYRRPIPPPPIPKKRLTTIPDMEIPNMDYESPIQIYLSQMQGQLEEGIYNTVRRYGIDVDKDELIKALINDRQQYVKGFRDGVRKFAELWKEETSKREIIWDTDEAIDILVEELVGEYNGD